MTTSRGVNDETTRRRVLIVGGRNGPGAGSLVNDAYTVVMFDPRTNTMTPLRFIPAADEWMQRRLRGYTESLGEWTMMGGNMLIQPAVANGATVTFPYLDKNCVRLAAGGYGDSFIADGDSFRLDERLLKLGMIWQWKAQKGSPYAEDMGSYSDALANAMGHDAPAPILIDRRPMSHSNRGVAYPWPVPT